MTLHGFSRRLILLFALAAACGDDDEDIDGPVLPPYGLGACEAFVDKAVSCGVATHSGTPDCEADRLSLCGVECTANASCSELEALACGDGISDT
ncbi:MAG TPA: hypothetical protein VM686_11055, partial [Polyangiaceae bacterium]|nr:hypothetical protein [Polyangiaceae bacterium]